ncbi:hypothetical protein HGRIS_001837 [Hohenbuehelia grisea]|uniref:Uncharacterized protein n=1 Tax=Hohenbuehelia grisea TaxID=104357 RepID=A0ABR3JJL8_9AGAR
MPEGFYQEPSTKTTSHPRVGTRNCKQLLDSDLTGPRSKNFGVRIQIYTMLSLPQAERVSDGMAAEMTRFNNIDTPELTNVGAERRVPPSGICSRSSSCYRVSLNKGTDRDRRS